ncbi:AMP-binding protein [Spirillospora sp. NBC_01491]|uniref:AMP-binding protein n=1 Tax=Spirillospora sp. NBC_01491 TaxID=2976007 RepID=UPI002E322C54|nr:AMP-binding protein [Spirillospora sp. NBC_01491]
MRDDTPTSADDRVRDIARARPDDPAVIVVAGGRAGGAAGSRVREDAVLTWDELDRASAELAARLGALAAGAVRRPVVVIDATNSADTVIGFAACMRARIPFLPLDPLAPAAEAGQVMAALAPAHWPVRLADARDGVTPPEPPAPPEPSAAPRPSAPQGPSVRPRPGEDAGYLLATGGSSGRPRVIAHPAPLDHDPVRVPSMMLRAVGWRHAQRQLIAGPLHHAAPFMCCWEGLLDANTLVLLPRFDAREMLRAIERHRVQWAQLTPVHLRWALTALRTQDADLGSLNAVVHTAAPCPAELKRAWIDLLGPERLFEIYGATEAIGTTLLRGDEWLAHPGSVGRGFCTQVRVLDEDGGSVPPGAEGEVYMRRTARHAPVGRDVAPSGGGPSGLKRTVDGFFSVGDHGRVDRDGYLHLGARRHDLVIVGGGNVYPAEVEAAIAEHPDVLDAAVIGRPDEALGARLLALVIARPGAGLTAEAVSAHAEARLAPHKVPWDVRFVTRLPRTEAGKLHRRRLMETEGSGV